MGACTYGLDQILAANRVLFITLLYATTRRNPIDHLSVQGWFPIPAFLVQSHTYWTRGT